MSPNQVLFGVVLPVVLCAASTALAWRVWSRRAEASLLGGWWGGGVGLAAGYIVAHLVISGTPNVPPSPAEHALVYLAAAGLLVGGAGVLLEAKLPLRLIGRVLVCIGAAALIARRKHFDLDQWTLAEFGAWVGVLGLIAAVFWTALDQVGRRNEGRGSGAALVLWITATGGAAVLTFGGSAAMGMSAGVVGAMAFACCLISWWRPRAVLGAPGLGVASLLLCGLTFVPYDGLWGYVETLPAALLLAGPVGAWLAGLVPLHKGRGWMRTLLHGIGALVPVGVAVAIALAGVESWDAYG